MNHLKSLLVTIGLILGVVVFALTLPASGLLAIGALMWFAVHGAMFDTDDDYEGGDL